MRKSALSYSDYIELCSDKYEAIASTAVGLLVGTVITLTIGAERIDVIIGEYLISLVITYICWYGNKVVSYWHNQRMPWQENPFKKSLYVVLLNGSYTAVAIFVALYFFFLINPAYNEFWGVSLKWGLIVGVLTSVFMNTFYTGVYFFDQWKESLLEAERLKRENVQAELNALRSQVNPHFLFNSLNTLTALIDEDQQKATQFVRNFSDFYRYTLQSQSQELSTLREELAATGLYLKMQEERFGQHLILKNNIPSDKLHWSIPTLTLQILIENCIKHNIISSSKPLTIELTVTDEHFLNIKNNLQPKKTKLPSTKLGLKNIQDRYSYLSNQLVEIKEEQDYFEVRVPLVA